MSVCVQRQRQQQDDVRVRRSAEFCTRTSYGVATRRRLRRRRRRLFGRARQMLKRARALAPTRASSIGHTLSAQNACAAWTSLRPRRPSPLPHKNTHTHTRRTSPAAPVFQRGNLIHTHTLCCVYAAFFLPPPTCIIQFDDRVQQI